MLLVEDGQLASFLRHRSQPENELAKQVLTEGEVWGLGLPKMK